MVLLPTNEHDASGWWFSLIHDKPEDWFRNEAEAEAGSAEADSTRKVTSLAGFAGRVTASVSGTKQLVRADGNKYEPGRGFLVRGTWHHVCLSVSQTEAFVSVDGFKVSRYDPYVPDRLLGSSVDVLVGQTSAQPWHDLEPSEACYGFWRVKPHPEGTIPVPTPAKFELMKEQAFPCGSATQK